MLVNSCNVNLGAVVKTDIYCTVRVIYSSRVMNQKSRTIRPLTDVDDI